MTLRKSFGTVLFITLVLSLGCIPDYSGYCGDDGEVLKNYLAPADLKALIENPDPPIIFRIIDVRSLSEYQAGHIPAAESYPADEIESRLDELSKDDYLFLYCHTGIRAQSVIVNILEPEPNSYTKFMNWGGTLRWEAEGYDLVQ